MRNDKHTLRHAILIAVITAFILSATTAQERSTQKLAQSGMKFLSVGLSARQAALADAFTAADGNSASMFYNPAGMARLGMFAEASLGQVNWIADIKVSSFRKQMHRSSRKRRSGSASSKILCQLRSWGEVWSEL